MTIVSFYILNMPSFTKEKWTCSHTAVLIFFTGAVAGLFALSWGVSQDPPELQNLKYFGLGKGPAFLNTFDASGIELNKGLYEEYFGYKRLIGQISVKEKENYKTWYTVNKCQGGCPKSVQGGFVGECARGLCWCKEDNPSQYGQCRPRSEAKYLGNKEKFRKPDLPPLPDHCYLPPMEVDGRVQKAVDDLQAHKPECQQKVSYPDTFNLEEQTCGLTEASVGDCFDRDMNLVCGDMNKCVCRQDMKWNEDRMQCELYLSADCTGVEEVDMTTSDNKEVEERIKGRSISTTSVDKEKARIVYCNMLEVHSKKHVISMRGGREEPTILGTFNTIGIILFGVACAFGFLWLIMISNMIRYFIRSMDPRNVMMDNMTTQEKMAAMAAVAGQEMVERQGEVRDERRAALMQGQNI